MTASKLVIVTIALLCLPILFVYSNNASDGDIRLVNGNKLYEGRIEVYYNSNWTSVSQVGWTKQDATVACRKLGFTNIVPIATRGGYYGQGTSNTALTNVMCTGNELSLLECNFEIETHDYRHYQDAGLRCVPKISNGSCDTGSARLINGTSNLTGRLEICIGGVWGTVVNTKFDHNDAQVICRQLGYYDKFAQIALRGFPKGKTEPVLLSLVNCSGSEAGILDCDYNGPSSADTDHFKDVGVKCLDKICKFGSVRLVNSLTKNEGRVEICIAGVWGTITDDGFGNIDAGVICRQLGFNFQNAIAFREAHFGKGTGPIYLKNLKCEGVELNILDCNYRTNLYYDTHDEDAGVKCELLEPTSFKHISTITLNSSSVKVAPSATSKRYLTSSIYIGGDDYSFQASDKKITQIIAGTVTPALVLIFIILIVIGGVIFYNHWQKRKTKFKEQEQDTLVTSSSL